MFKLTLSMVVLLCLGCSTLKEEFGVKSLLKKYEWFKNASAQLDAKLASLKAYSARKKAMVESYKDTPRRDWAREDREQFNLWEIEMAGLKANYNNLAASYNSQMAKVNWRFANVGGLPEGASEPLPREYREYMEN